MGKELVVIQMVRRVKHRQGGDRLSVTFAGETSSGVVSKTLEKERQFE